MAGFEMLVLLLACKATLILGLVAGLFVLAGRRWPQKCVLCQRFGVAALLALPVAGWALPTVGVPVLSAGRPIIIDEDGEHARPLAAPLRRAAGRETHKPAESSGSCLRPVRRHPPCAVSRQAT